MIDYSLIQPQSRAEVLDDLSAASTLRELKIIEPYVQKFGLRKEFDEVKTRIMKEKSMNNCSKIVGRLLVKNAQARKYSTPLIGPEFGYYWDPNKPYNLASLSQARKMVAKAGKIQPLPSPLTFSSFANWCDKTGAMGLTLHDIYDINKAKK